MAMGILKKNREFATSSPGFIVPFISKSDFRPPYKVRFRCKRENEPWWVGEFVNRDYCFFPSPVSVA